MYALFVNDEFKTIMLNASPTKAEIERQIKAIDESIKPADCTVIEYNSDFSPDQNFIFNSNKDLLTCTMVKEEIAIGVTEDLIPIAILSEKKVATVTGTIGILRTVYDNGAIVVE